MEQRRERQALLQIYPWRGMTTSNYKKATKVIVIRAFQIIASKIQNYNTFLMTDLKINNVRYYQHDKPLQILSTPSIKNKSMFHL